MASMTATATMAAATSGLDKKSKVSDLQTPPISATYPSELRSPMVGTPGYVKQEEGLKTPITPPSAYLDFLKNLSPALMSPAPTGTSTRFSFGDKATEKTSEPPAEKTGKSTSPPTSQPALSRNTSYDSNTSITSVSSAATDQSARSYSTTLSDKTRPQSPRISIPSSVSAFAKPGPRSARTPRRLHIPQSPFSPAIGSAQSMPSPYASTPLSAAPWSATYSPREYDPVAKDKSGKVSVRQVVTRTVTYCRTPLDPAPKGKRRKLEESE